jgi:hypothetical protein
MASTRKPAEVQDESNPDSNPDGAPEATVEHEETVVAAPTRTVRMRMSGNPVYAGVMYTITAGEKITVPAEVAAYWIAHNMTYDN